MKRINPKTASPEAVRVQERLTRIGLGWADMGTILDITDQRLYYWRKQGIPKPQLEPIASFLGCTVDWLLTGKTEKVAPTADREFLASLTASTRLSDKDCAILRAMAESLMNAPVHAVMPPSQSVEQAHYALH
ncbi:hypothetical protein [Marinobacter sp. ELB17]|uniref:hypothetical protein n=1 Tax=Marinobacter sp. ELB17 TaxID=270374 RepID=UPI0000F36A8B|nr:hypothetical protein [Marinobacter sp. ELB17]EAZ97480.1 hypothetical protein MELB17_10043 [Marinobacter sp. ELB17]